MTLAIANTVAVVTPTLGFVAGVFFTRWMRDRRRARHVEQIKWGREARP